MKTFYAVLKADYVRDAQEFLALDVCDIYGDDFVEDEISVDAPGASVYYQQQSQDLSAFKSELLSKHNLHPVMLQCFDFYCTDMEVTTQTLIDTVFLSIRDERVIRDQQVFVIPNTISDEKAEKALEYPEQTSFWSDMRHPNVVAISKLKPEVIPNELPLVIVCAVPVLS